VARNARDFALPMLCASTGPGLRARGWVYELKLDGVRIIADKREGGVDLWYRSGRETTASYPEIASAVAELGVKSAVFDGEIVAFDGDGRPSFQRLEQRIGLESPRDIAQAGKDVPVAYVVFDLLALDGRDLRDASLVERRKVLESVVPDAGFVRCLDYLEDDGTPLFDMCRRERLEGVIAKRAASPYRSGIRSDDWVKMKCQQDEDFVVVGYTRGTGSRGALGALDLASYEGDALVVRGKVGSGLDDRTIRSLLARFEDLTVPGPSARGEYMSAPRGRTHLRPEIVVSVRYGAWSDDGRVRFPVFRGVRHDVEPSACRAAPPTAPHHAELADYYGAVEEALLRYLVGRSSISSSASLRESSPPLRVKTDGWAVFDADTQGARTLNALMTALDLPSFAKTGDGLDWQVIVPLGDAPASGAAAFAELGARIAAPGVVRVASAPILAPWSPVAGAGSRVSAPIGWDEITPALDPRRITTRQVPARLAAGDPMAPLVLARVDFAAAIARLDERLAPTKA
jgi:DNA ligase D-like protein (predicted ligase)